ncbi:MAG: SusD/RagB family nutrient-binding outer membrane lipoprotein [Flavobacteriaceae bacterium]|nr:SusD/RagB family nutrient-binding outer membrane lipoprotein [Flavobacteriaceae bacterium]
MKKYIIKHVSIMFIFVLLLSGCSDSIEGINSDPLAAIKIEPGLLFPQVFLSGISAQRTVESNAINMQAQQWSTIVGFGVFVNPERYTISPNTTNNIWVGYFTNGLRNLQQMRILTETNNPTATNIIGQAKVIEAFIFLNLTQIFGDIPFSEAQNVNEFPNPNFDTQEEALRGMVVLLDEALVNLANPTEIIVDGDLLYGGDRESWIRFANSLKLRILMIIANVDPSVASEIQNTANQPLITSNEFVAKLDFIDTSGNENPIWRTIDRFAGGVNDFWGAGIALVDIMNTSDDPRRATYFDDVNGAYIGQQQGVFSSAGISSVSLKIMNPTMPDIYATAAETHFYLAEAVLQGWITGDADAHYKAGIQTSLDFYDGSAGEILDADKTTFMASPKATLAGDDMATAMKKIHEEIYVSNFTRGLAAWTNWRRNKTPNFELPVGAVLNTTIRRYQVPLSEITSNPNAPTTLPELDQPMWFEK